MTETFSPKPELLAFYVMILILGFLFGDVIDRGDLRDFRDVVFFHVSYPPV